MKNKFITLIMDDSNSNGNDYNNASDIKTINVMDWDGRDYYLAQMVPCIFAVVTPDMLDPKKLAKQNLDQDVAGIEGGNRNRHFRQRNLKQRQQQQLQQQQQQHNLHLRQQRRRMYEKWLEEMEQNIMYDQDNEETKPQEEEENNEHVIKLSVNNDEQDENHNLYHHLEQQLRKQVDGIIMDKSKTDNLDNDESSYRNRILKPLTPAPAGGQQQDTSSSNADDETTKEECADTGHLVVRVAIAFDSTFCRAAGGDQIAMYHIQDIVAQTSHLYTQQNVCVKLEIGYLEGYCDKRIDPYAIGLNVENQVIGCRKIGLLDWFANFWSLNRANTVTDVDAVHLFYNKNLGGSGVGCARFFELCNNAYGVESMDFSRDVNRRATLFAHELGHNFGLGHQQNADGFKYIMHGVPSTGDHIWHQNDLQTFKFALPMFNCLRQRGNYTNTTTSMIGVRNAPTFAPTPIVMAPSPVAVPSPVAAPVYVPTTITAEQQQIMQSEGIVTQARQGGDNDAQQQDSNGGGPCASYKVAVLAIAYESTFCAAEGGNSTTVMHTIQNIVAKTSLMFEQQGVCVKLKIGYLEGFCDPKDDPYTEGLALDNTGCQKPSKGKKSKNNGGLLEWFSGYWSKNMNAKMLVKKKKIDAVHLFYHRRLANGGIGCTRFFELCNQAVGVNSMDFSNDETRRAAMLAHELGHNFGLGHHELQDGGILKYIMHSGVPSNGAHEWHQSDLETFKVAIPRFTCLRDEYSNEDGENQDVGQGIATPSPKKYPPPFSIQSTDGSLCLTVVGSIATNGAQPKMMPCSVSNARRTRRQLQPSQQTPPPLTFPPPMRQGESQLWVLDEENHLHTVLDYTKCLQPDVSGNVLWDCAATDPRQKWDFDTSDGALVNINSGECLGSDTATGITKVLPCSSNDPSQGLKKVVKKNSIGGSTQINAQSTPPPTQAFFKTTGIPKFFNLQSQDNFLCLSTDKIFQGQGTKEPDMVHCSISDTFQFWSLDDRGYLHSAAQYMKCLAIEPHGMATGTSAAAGANANKNMNGVKVKLERCEMYNQRQQWSWDARGLLKNVHMLGYCLAIKHNGITDNDVGQSAHMWTCGNFEIDQHWTQIDVDKTSLVGYGKHNTTQANYKKSKNNNINETMSGSAGNATGTTILEIQNTPEDAILFIALAVGFILLVILSFLHQKKKAETKIF